MNLQLLLDENLSPFLVKPLAELGVFAQAVAHLGLSGEPDHVVWKFALDRGMVAVTTNAQDFLVLADVDLHPGLILFRESGLSRGEQWSRLEPVIQFLKNQADPNFLLNRVIEILGPNRFREIEIPKPKF